MRTIHRLRSGYEWVNGWVEQHWGLKRAVLSSFAILPLSFVLISAVVGALLAYEVSSPAAIVPLEMWAEYVAPEGGFEYPSEAAIYIGMGGMGFAVADIVGRFVYAYLLWVPLPVWTAAGYLVFALPIVVLTLNLIWVAQRAYSKFNRPPKTRSDIDG